MVIRNFVAYCVAQGRPKKAPPRSTPPGRFYVRLFLPLPALERHGSNDGEIPRFTFFGQDEQDEQDSEMEEQELIQPNANAPLSRELQRFLSCKSCSSCQETQFLAAGGRIGRLGLFADVSVMGMMGVMPGLPGVLRVFAGNESKRLSMNLLHRKLSFSDRG
jgi:hypothetical protein